MGDRTRPRSAVMLYCGAIRARWRLFTTKKQTYQNHSQLRIFRSSWLHFRRLSPGCTNRRWWNVIVPGRITRLLIALALALVVSCAGLWLAVRAPQRLFLA